MLLAFLLYVIFCRAFSASVGALSLSELIRLALWMTLLYGVVLGSAWGVSRLARLRHPQHVAFLFVAPQKSEGMAVAIIRTMFRSADDVALYCLPVVIYHTVQMLVSTPLSQALRRSVPRPGEGHQGS